MLRKLAGLALLGLLSAGCSSHGEGFEPDNASFSGRPYTQNGLAQVVYQAAQTLADRAIYLDKKRPIVVATVVSVDDLGSSSTFGRLASQLVANRIGQRGYLVRDVTYMRAVEMQPSGELVLSREASKVSADVKAQALVAGTYSVGGKEIYLNLRMLSADTGEMLSSADAVIPLDDNTTPLVGDVFSMRSKVSFDHFEEMAQSHAAMSEEMQKAHIVK